MPDLKSLDNIYLILTFLVPGLVVVWIRSRFLTGRIPPHTEAFLTYLAVSVVYYALALPAIPYVLSLDEPGYEKALAWFGLVFIGPAVLGLCLGKLAQWDRVREILECIGIHVTHTLPSAWPSAWDWKFHQTRAQWVLVVLKDDTKFRGYFGRNSFASSDPHERDIYIERIYDIDGNEKWTPLPQGVLISGGEIRSIEFWPDTERRDEQGQGADRANAD